MERRAVVTGIGIISPIGVGVSDFWNSCLRGSISVDRIPEKWKQYYDFSSSLWAPLPEIDYRNYVSRVELLQLDMTQIITLASAQLALEDASFSFAVKDAKKNTYTVENITPSEVGVFMGTGIGGVKSLVSLLSNHIFAPTKSALASAASDSKGPDSKWKEISDRLEVAPRFNPFAVAMTMPNACSARVGIKYSLTGPNRTYCSACSSGTVSIGHAFRAVKNGEANVALAGGVEYLSDDYGGIFRGFDVAGTLVRNCDDPETANRPFDRNRSGFLFAEGGGAVLVVEELSHAIERGATVYAEITGFAETFDAYSIMSIAEDGVEEKRMLAEALKEAKADPAEIDYVNTHGTGTVQNDEIESMIIADTFRDDVLVNATKSLTGHVIGGSGAIEASVTALSLHNGTTHVCRNLSEPVRDLNFVTTVEDHSIRKAVSQSFAFGGHNAALVMERY